MATVVRFNDNLKENRFLVERTECVVETEAIIPIRWCFVSMNVIRLLKIGIHNPSTGFTQLETIKEGKKKENRSIRLVIPHNERRDCLVTNLISKSPCPPSIT